MSSFQKLFMTMPLLILLAACTGEISPKDGELGTEATESDVQNSIQKATQGISPLDAKVGQSVHMEYNARIESGTIMKLGDMNRRVAAIREDEQAIKYTYFEDYFKFTPSGELVDEWHKERSIEFMKNMQTLMHQFSRFDKIASRAMQSQNFTTTEDPEPNVCDGKDVKDSDGNVYDCIRYYNLKSERRRVPVPEVIANKPNCLGIPECQFTVQYLEYDEVLWHEGKSIDKITYRVNVAKEVPHVYPDTYLPPVTSLCQKTKQDFAERKNVIVTYCRILRNMDL